MPARGLSVVRRGRGSRGTALWKRSLSKGRSGEGVAPLQRRAARSRVLGHGHPGPSRRPAPEISPPRSRPRRLWSRPLSCAPF